MIFEMHDVEYLVPTRKGQKWEHKPIHIAGSSSTGKSVLAEKLVEFFHEKENCTIIYLIDISDEFESACAMLKPTLKRHISSLESCGMKPEAKNVIIHAPLSVKGIKKMMGNARIKFGDHGQPKIDFFTISLKKFGREEAEFLNETDVEKGSISIMLETSKRLKQNEGIYQYYDHAEKISKEFASTKEWKDVLRRLKIFEQDDFLKPDNCETNFDARKILTDQKNYHVFTNITLEKDDKERAFVSFHILNEIEKNMYFATHPVVIIHEETQRLAPYRGEGREKIYAKHVAKKFTTVRKTGKGITVIFLSTTWSGIDEDLRNSCKKRATFYLEAQDILNLKKVYSFTKPITETIESLETGEFVVQGKGRKMLKIIKSRLPRHGHKHSEVNFETEYRKQYPELVTDYTEFVKVQDRKNRELKSVWLEELRRRNDVNRKKKEKEEVKKLKESKVEVEIEQVRVERKEKKKIDKGKRDELIMTAKKELEKNNEKVSVRNVEKKFNELVRRYNLEGLKVSRETVRNILKLSSQLGGNKADEEPSEN